MLVGDASEWSARFLGLERKLAVAIEDTWPRCFDYMSRVGNVPKEDPITRCLVYALRAAKPFPGRIETQYELLRPSTSGIVAPSRIDFVVTIGDHEEVYLACECKRLNVPTSHGRRPQADKYVEQGLIKFSNGQYATSLPVGVMLGYVIDGDVAFAHESILTAIASRAGALGLRRHHHVLPSRGAVRFASLHSSPLGEQIEVRHTLLAVPVV